MEDRVLVEFHLDARRRPFDVTVPHASPYWNDSPAVLNDAAARDIRSLQFDPADPTRIDPKRTYRVTVIFCLTPDGHCARLVPYPGTPGIVVEAQRVPPEESSHIPH